MPFNNTKRQLTPRNPRIIITDDLQDCSSDPYFVKKNEVAKAFIAKHGLPKALYKK